MQNMAQMLDAPEELRRQMLRVCNVASDEDAVRHGMCIGIVTSQREGGVGLGYLHQSLASIVTGVRSLGYPLRAIQRPTL